MVISFDVTWCFLGLAIAALVGYGIMTVVNVLYNAFRDSTMLGSPVLPYVVICVLASIIIFMVVAG